MAKLTASQERELHEAFDLFDSGRYNLLIRTNDESMFFFVQIIREKFLELN